ncbi:SDR family NAD(P)-dependent oxidoreductase [Candidatus Venteria ishoeyi]|uniref:Benzil reductase ((S)-benzoin forming) n=1 Tax=Candidatus Venteria ishoeyi TaxID=1899563 RepID=A0A1H6FFY6_9GAMM|nr:SDR family NAD(P)-dependent oxidoreductase [Candidatus Venteria ishoeyi]MDM8547883.1 SDR family NAD(P)-dependent oxidoreductase [Candidatus Venteria ishoeyi]SEH08972.1 Benzil reductase ((S)-benzoin forming) [Candidatus Venteria ishoeyi]
MKEHKLFITGNSQGLGHALSKAYLDLGWQVYGCSRQGCDISQPALHDIRCDLSIFEQIPATLDTLLTDINALDLVILNAGILGKIQDLHKTPLADMQPVMDINLWANKVILDYFHQRALPIKQIIAISSGAAVSGSRGWNAYALSKASLNMLMNLYAHELPDTHLCAIAPGLIDSQMMDYLCVEPDPEQYPALQRIRAARGTEVMPEPDDAAQRILRVVSTLRNYPSGSYVDIRQILAPEEYTQFQDGCRSS